MASNRSSRATASPQAGLEHDTSTTRLTCGTGTNVCIDTTRTTCGGSISTSSTAHTRPALPPWASSVVTTSVQVPSGDDGALASNGSSSGPIRSGSSPPASSGPRRNDTVTLAETIPSSAGSAMAAQYTAPDSHAERANCRNSLVIVPRCSVSSGTPATRSRTSAAMAESREAGCRSISNHDSGTLSENPRPLSRTGPAVMPGPFRVTRPAAG